MSGIAWIVVIAASLVLIWGVVTTLKRFKRRARDPERRRRLGDHIRTKWE